ncbi:MAG: radical SAM protein [Muribaculaceae bacterium]|nr:radical SAM protein [Muribaculaceae bacterium]
MNSRSLNKDSIKRYFDIQVPVTACNLRCDYCYISHHHHESAEIKPLKYSNSHIRKALSRERLGGTCLLNLCGSGETLLPLYVVDLTRELLEEGHYVMLVTNGLSTKRFKELVKQIPADLQKHLMLKISFHFMELKSKELFEKFFANIRLIEDSDISFTVELTPSDDEIPYIDEIKELCLKNLGALCHITVARDNTKPEIPILSALSRDEYISVWGQFDSPLFDFKMQIFGEPRKEECYNGLWGGYINLETGSISQCYGLRPARIFDNLSAPIDFCPVVKCKKAQCYNGHSWLTFGMIPELATPTHLEMRDRITLDGRHWVGEEMRRFLSHKLSENNEMLSSKGKWTALMRNRSNQAVYTVRRLVDYIVNGEWSVLRSKFQNFVKK